MEEKEKQVSEMEATFEWTDNTKIENCKQCVDCKYRDKRIISGKITATGKDVLGYTKGVCERYKIVKPLKVILNQGDCPDYTKDSQK